MKPQMGDIKRDEVPFWLWDYWIIFIGVISICFTPATSFMWDLVYGLIFIGIYSMTAYSWLYFASSVWRMIFGPRRKTFEEQLGMRLPSCDT
jgi:hypothetical protein